MIPVIAIVGRPNVGKSTLFNCLTRSRDALVADLPGVTRDRKYAEGRLGNRQFVVVDTGGLAGPEGPLNPQTARQAMRAVQDADAVILVVDGRQGRLAADETIATTLRRTAKPLFLTVNKTDGVDEAVACGEFHQLGLGIPLPIAASHGRGVTAMIEQVLDALPHLETLHAAPPPDGGVVVAIVGRPNVGKSTLTNRILGEQRVVVSELPGTTRDSIYVPFKRDGERYTLVDTAGVRRRGRIDEHVEKFSVVKTLQSIEAAHVVIMVVDAREGIGHQDAALLGFVLDSGRALVLAVNKWDGLEAPQKDALRGALRRKLGFLDYVDTHFISALHGTGVGRLFDSIRRAYASATRALPTPELTRLLQDAVAQHAPPLVRGRRIKLRYAHQGGRNPPLVVIHGNQTDAVPDSYARYLVNYLREALDLHGTPVRVELKSGANPYRDKKNVLTPRQLRKRQRLIRHAKRSG